MTPRPSLGAGPVAVPWSPCDCLRYVAERYRPLGANSPKTSDTAGLATLRPIGELHALDDFVALSRRFSDWNRSSSPAQIIELIETKQLGRSCMAGLTCEDAGPATATPSQQSGNHSPDGAAA